MLITHSNLEQCTPVGASYEVLYMYYIPMFTIDGMFSPVDSATRYDSMSDVGQARIRAKTFSCQYLLDSQRRLYEASEA